MIVDIMRYEFLRQPVKVLIIINQLVLGSDYRKHNFLMCGRGTMKFEKSQSDTIMVLSMVLSETCNILITSYIPLQFQTLQNKTEGVLFDNYTLIYSVIS